MGGQYKNGPLKMGINMRNWIVSAQDRDYLRNYM